MIINKGFLVTLFLILLFVLYVILKRYVRKRTPNRPDIENQTSSNNYTEINLLDDAREFQTIVSTVLN